VSPLLACTLDELAGQHPSVTELEASCAESKRVRDSEPSVQGDRVA
jgi:hypothetical protein